MNAVNLIPAHRHHAKQRRSRIRWVTTACVIYGLLLLGGYGFVFAAWGASDQTVAEELFQLQKTSETNTRLLTAVQPKLLEAKATLSANLSVGRQPDWSILLDLLAKSTGEYVVLESCELEQIEREEEQRRPDLPAAQAKYLLSISGLAKSQIDVSQFVLGLEKSQLFDQVNLVETARRSLNDYDCVVFKLACSLGPGKAESP